MRPGRRLQAPRRWALHAGCAIAGLLAPAAWAEPSPQEYAWSAPLAVTSSAGVQRLRVPDDGVAALRGPAAEDLRIVNGAGQVVPHARLPQAAPPAAAAEPVDAGGLAVHALKAAAARARGGERVSVVIDGRRVAVDLGGEGAAAALAAGVIVDTRRQRDPLDGLEVGGALPANLPVTFDVAISRDLQHWQPVAATATLYRFEGPDAPVERRIRFAQPLDVRDALLRLVPRTADGVAVDAVRGWRAARTAAEPDRVRIVLDAPAAGSAEAVEWLVPVALPVVAVEIRVLRENTLLPLRVTGRPADGSPWRPLGATVAYRLADGAGGTGTNPPQPIGPVELSRIRLERSGAVGDVADARVQLVLHVQPVELAFVPSGPPPYTLLAGRPATPAAALPLASVVPGWRPGDEQRLPRAEVGAGQRRVPAAPGGLPGLAQAARGAAGRETLLWAVLLGGVAVLGAIAALLLRQLRRGS